MKKPYVLTKHKAHSGDSDQTGRVSRLNWADANLSRPWVHMSFYGFCRVPS